MLKTLGLVMAVLLIGACYGEPDAPAAAPVAPSEAELAASACEDLHLAHLAMCQRCGITPPLPAGSPGAAWKYSSCANVTVVHDMDALYNTCLPALASGCYQGDTPAAIGCHQFDF